MNSRKRSLGKTFCSINILSIFASSNNIRLLATSKSWSMVGTFKMMSEWHLQLFTFHTFVADKLCLFIAGDIRTYASDIEALLNKQLVCQLHCIITKPMNPKVVQRITVEKCASMNN
ncbi:hypothetical protein T4D_9076 [Trichinella pseudospiralis]|uniref:Uncharacterized protein n=1 Tax=Trichinella pseudospiralis TaxID=6337 RepID=A0A0V1F759_TRIPS|nr:hypothetical protein T4D_9076 [Trichinella pseudospiralis]